MKRIIAAGAIGFLALTGCSTSDEPTPTKTVFVTPSAEPEYSPPASEFSPVEQEFLHDIGLYITPELNAQPDQGLIDLGRIVCDALDKGVPLQSVVEAGSKPGALSFESMQVVAASAVVNFCPQHNTGAGSKV